VQVRITAPPLLTFACHCRACQKLTASAFSLTTMFPSDAVTCTGALITGGLRAPARQHVFCATCLGFIYSKITGADHRINLRSALLENATEFPPFLEVMTRDKMPWATTPARQSYDTVPADSEALQDLMAAYAHSENL
jgi:hypothetical protein